MSQGWVALTSRQIAGVRRGIFCERVRHALSRSMLHSPSSSPNRFRPSGKQIFVSIKSHLSNRPVIRYKHFGTTTTDNYNNYYPYFRRTCCKMSRKREGEGDWGYMNHGSWNDLTRLVHGPCQVGSDAKNNGYYDALKTHSCTSTGWPWLGRLNICFFFCARETILNHSQLGWVRIRILVYFGSQLSLRGVRVTETYTLYFR